MCLSAHTLKRTTRHRSPWALFNCFAEDEDLPPLLQTQDGEEAWTPTLLELTNFYRNHVKLFRVEASGL